MLEQGMHKVMIIAEKRASVSGSPFFRPPVDQRGSEYSHNMEYHGDIGSYVNIPSAMNKQTDNFSRISFL